MRAPSVFVACALSLLWVWPARAQQERAGVESAEVQRALREEITERYREVTGQAIPPAALEQALRETLALRAQQARAVAERYAADALERARVGTLAQPKLVLQVRSGAGGGNPNTIDMVGHTSAYVREKASEPLVFGPAVDINEDSRAWFQGGYLPEGKALVITKVTWRASAAGDSNGHGEAIVRAGEQTLLEVRDVAAPQEGSWEGRIVIRPGQESTVQVEVANSSALEATFEGKFEDLPPAAEAVEGPALGGAAGPRWDPSQGVSIRSQNGNVVVCQGDTVLWEGQGRSVSTQTRMDGGRKALAIVVDGVEVLRLQAPE